jgi:hypothetical protein
MVVFKVVVSVRSEKGEMLYGFRSEWHETREHGQRLVLVAYCHSTSSDESCGAVAVVSIQSMEEQSWVSVGISCALLLM